VFLRASVQLLRSGLLTGLIATGPLCHDWTLDARPSSGWCQQALTRLAFPSLLQKLHRLGSQINARIDHNQTETLAELAKRRTNIQPLGYGRTVIESSVLFWMIAYGMEGLKLLNTTLGAAVFGGNAEGLQIRNEILQDPALMTLLVSVYAPMTEEISFRFLPRFFFGKSWKVGTASSLAFGFVHNVQQIPIPQMVAGFYLWSLMRNRGISHAILSHAVNNTWVVILILIK
jgi:hypothetical protein